MNSEPHSRHTLLGMLRILSCASALAGVGRQQIQPSDRTFWAEVQGRLDFIQHRQVFFSCPI